ncbi:cubilin-like [Apostichopus japonicus]|uniref:cubilin-like n=1 Tax=Stichopus japonicus TaxID=307972 RepID=UPI003AB2691D
MGHIWFVFLITVCLCQLQISITHTTSVGVPDGNPPCLQGDCAKDISKKGNAVHNIEDELRWLTDERGCSRTLRDDTGMITSPNWPRKFTKFLKCDFEIIVEGTRRIQLIFKEFLLIGNGTCMGNNYVQITDVNYNRTEVICGSYKGFVWTSDGNRLLIKFQAEAETDFHLFQATYTATEKHACGESFHQAFGMYSFSNPTSNDTINSNDDNAETVDRSLCTLLFHTTPAHRLSISFETIEVLCDEPLLILDPLTGQSTAGCTYYETVSLTSTGNEIIIQFSQDSTLDLALEYEAFTLEESTFPTCSNFLKAPAATFTSPSYPAFYPSNIQCWILIHADFTEIIQITFGSFSVEKSEENGCEADYVQMKDLASDRLTRVCGTFSPFTWTSDTNEVLVTFTSNEYSTNLGYQASYSTMPRFERNDCFDLDEDSFSTSLGFPASQPTGQDCRHLLQADPGYYFILEFIIFDLGGHDPCQHQYLQLTDVTSQRVETICGRLSPFVWTSSSNEIQLHLLTTENGVRFYLKYKKLPLPSRHTDQLGGCNLFLDTSAGHITYPNTNSDSDWTYPRECLYIIHGTPGTYVTVNFDDLLIEQPISDVNSRGMIQILDPTALNVFPAVDTFVTSQPGFSWTSKRNELHLRVTERQQKQNIRFSAEYKIRQLDENEGSLRFVTDRQGEHSLPEDCLRTSRDCHLLFHASPKERVLIRFRFVNFSTTDCRMNSLKITDFHSNEVTHICSSSSNFSLLSFGNEMLLSFKGSFEPGQVSASFSHVIQARPPASDNHQFLKQQKGDFTSLTSSVTSYTGKQPTSRNSIVIIQVEHDDKILLRLKHIVSVEKSDEGELTNRLEGSGCNDSVKFHDLTSNREELVCNLADSFAWTSDSNTVEVSFNMSLSLDEQAFRASFTAISRYNGTFLELKNDTGTLQSIGYPLDYPAMVRHQWLIHANPGDIISLVFNEFILQDSTNCMKDFVRVEDQVSGKSLIICGDQQFVWLSDANEVLVTFETDKEEQKKGFSLGYEVIPDRYTGDCLYRFNEISGEFIFDKEDINFHNQLQERAFCQFIIETGSEYRLQIKISDLILQDCDTAEIVFVDLGSYQTTEICQIENIFAWTSDSNAVFLHLLTYKQGLPPFTLTWKSIDRSRPRVCTATVRDENSWLLLSNIQSFQNRPNKCQIVVNFRPNRRIIISLHEAMTTSTNCSIELTIEDSVTGRLDRLCDVNSSFPYTWTSDSNEAVVTITQSADGGLAEGAKIYFNAIYRTPYSDCSKTLTADQGVLVSTDFPDNYPPNQFCSVLIHAINGRRVRINMQEFVLEGNGTIYSCQNGDFITLTDMSSLNSHIVCGHLHPFTWTSFGNEVLIDFKSDENLELKGFHGTYETLTRASPLVQDCNLVLIEDPGRIELVPNQAWLNSATFVTCLFLIQAHPSQQIIISFEQVYLPANAECTDTFAMIFDVTSSKSVTLCGDLATFKWTSIANEVEIHFQTDAPSRDQRLTASYTFISRPAPSSCDRVFSSMESTIISSEGFHEGNYPNDQDCTYYIQAGMNQIVEITFDHFDLELSKNCKYDYVEVQNNNLEPMDRFCGKKTVFSWLSSNNLAKIVFHSDHVITRKGFTAHFRFITEEMKPVRACNQTLTDPDGNLSSPGFPANYGYNQDCYYSIRVEKGKVVLISFYHFDLESDEECKFDYLEIQAVPDGRMVRYCGSLNPFNWTASTNHVSLTFHSDGSSAFSGFAANYSEVLPSTTPGVSDVDVPACYEKLEGHSGFFSSPSFPDPYLNNEDCRIDFKAPVGTRVAINLFFMDVEYEPSCKFDYVLFVDGVSNDRSGRFCGRTSEPFTWESITHHVIILFHTDEIVKRSGFYGFFTEIPE